MPFIKLIQNRINRNFNMMIRTLIHTSIKTTSNYKSLHTNDLKKKIQFNLIT